MWCMGLKRKNLLSALARQQAFWAIKWKLCAQETVHDVLGGGCVAIGLQQLWTTAL